MRWIWARVCTSQLTSRRARDSGTHTAATSATGMMSRIQVPYREPNACLTQRTERLVGSGASRRFSSRWRVSTRLNPNNQNVSTANRRIPHRFAVKRRNAPSAMGRSAVPRPNPTTHRGGTRAMATAVPAAAEALSDAERRVVNAAASAQKMATSRSSAVGEARAAISPVTS